jgi:hypothetical protein
LEDSGERLSQERLTGTGWSDQEDVRFSDLHIALRTLDFKAFVVIMHRDRKSSFREILSYNVLIKKGLDVLGLWNLRLRRQNAFSLDLLRDDVIAEIDTLVTDIN